MRFLGLLPLGPSPLGQWAERHRGGSPRLQGLWGMRESWHGTASTGPPRVIALDERRRTAWRTSCILTPRSHARLAASGTTTSVDRRAHKSYSFIRSNTEMGMGMARNTFRTCGRWSTRAKARRDRWPLEAAIEAPGTAAVRSSARVGLPRGLAATPWRWTTHPENARTDLHRDGSAIGNLSS